MPLLSVIEDLKEKKNIKGKVLFNFPLSAITSLGIGGPASVFIYPKTKKDIEFLIFYSKENNIPITFLGNGTNILVRDNGISGIVICLKNSFRNFELTNKILRVESGVSLVSISKVLMSNGISGFEFTYGIPGTFGGGIIMNAGAFGHTISEFIEEVVTIDRWGNDKIYTKEDFKFSYRSSIFKEKGEFIFSAKMKFSDEDEPQKIFKKMQKYKKIRDNTQPVGAKTAGSVFKNPKDLFAGKLIEEVGLKGYRIGDAMISYTHANFIENIGNAKSSDIENLIEHIKERVYTETGIELETEINILGKK